MLSSPEPRLEPLSRLEPESKLGVRVRPLSDPEPRVSESLRLDPVSSDDDGILKPKSKLGVDVSGSMLDNGSLNDGVLKPELKA